MIYAQEKQDFLFTIIYFKVKDRMIIEITYFISKYVVKMFILV